MLYILLVMCPLAGTPDVLHHRQPRFVFSRLSLDSSASPLSHQQIRVREMRDVSRGRMGASGGVGFAIECGVFIGRFIQVITTMTIMVCCFCQQNTTHSQSATRFTWIIDKGCKNGIQKLINLSHAT